METTAISFFLRNHRQSESLFPRLSSLLVFGPLHSEQEDRPDMNTAISCLSLSARSCLYSKRARLTGLVEPNPSTQCSQVKRSVRTGLVFKHICSRLRFSLNFEPCFSFKLQPGNLLWSTVLLLNARVFSDIPNQQHPLTRYTLALDTVWR